MRRLFWLDNRLRLENLSLRQVAIGVSILGLANWAILQFGLLPMMTAQQRDAIYPTWVSNPYIYAASLAFVCAAIWFVFSYRGSHSTQRRRIIVFAMALGTLGGMLLMLVIRTTWHI